MRTSSKSIYSEELLKIISDYDKDHSYSQEIAMLILDMLEYHNINKSELASMMGFSRQDIDEWVKGKYDFKLSTLLSLGECLKVNIFGYINELEKRSILTGDVLTSINGKYNVLHYLEEISGAK